MMRGEIAAGSRSRYQWFRCAAMSMAPARTKTISRIGQSEPRYSRLICRGIPKFRAIVRVPCWQFRFFACESTQCQLASWSNWRTSVINDDLVLSPTEIREIGDERSQERLQHVELRSDSDVARAAAVGRDYLPRRVGVALPVVRLTTNRRAVR